MVHHATYEMFVQLHKPQLESSGIPEHFWHSLYRKVINEEFDAGNVFSLMQIDYEDVARGEYDPNWRVMVKAVNGIKAQDPEQIYLIDHAWTFRIENAKKQLLGIDSLRERLAVIVGVDDTLAKEELADEIFKNMWKFCNFYSIGNTENVEDRIPIWYVMDELGSAIGHSDKPNFRVVPFVYVPEQITYSLLFPIVDVEYSEVVYRDFIEGVTDEHKRSALLLPWVFKSFENMDFKHIQPDNDYFLTGHVKETLPDLEKLQTQIKKSKYKVFTEYSLIEQYLTDNKFELVKTENEADILWYTNHFKCFEELSETPNRFVNQFPFEYILTVKDLICVICRRKDYAITENLNMYPKWLPITYNLKTELTQFASYYQNRQKVQLDNYWIVKPFNLARGLDTYITNNLNFILRLACTGSKIVQKYITNPVLFYRSDCSGFVKFDLRYVVLLKAVKPLEVYIYKNFFLRFSNKPFELNDFQDYEKHFTVMNYNDTAELKHMLCEDFKLQWRQQYPSQLWESVDQSICYMLKEIFERATLEDPPRGIAASPQSRALYAADIMLEWIDDEIQPKILEINWTPDCKRACEYYPNFYNDIFNLFFFDKENTDVFYKL